MNFELLHGECVSLGMVGAMRMALYLEMIDEQSVNRVKNTLDKSGFRQGLKALMWTRFTIKCFMTRKLKGASLPLYFQGENRRSNTVHYR